MKVAGVALFLLFFAIVGCGKESEPQPQSQPQEQNVTREIDIAKTPAGTYELTSVLAFVVAGDNKATATFNHKLKTPGTISRDDDDFTVTSNWDGADPRVRAIYLWLNLPLSIRATGSDLEFLNRKFYKPYAIPGSSNLIVWNNDSGRKFHEAYSRGTKDDKNKYKFEDARVRYELSGMISGDDDLILTGMVEMRTPADPMVPRRYSLLFGYKKK